MKLKNLLTNAFTILLTIFALFNCISMTASADSFYDEFYVLKAVGDTNLKTVTYVNVYQGQNTSSVDVHVTLENTYTPVDIVQYTELNEQEALYVMLDLLYDELNGVIYNTNDCFITTYCYDYDEFGHTKFTPMTVTEYYGMARTYWNYSLENITNNDEFSFTITLYDRVHSTTVKIFGQEYTIYYDETDDYVLVNESVVQPPIVQEPIIQPIDIVDSVTTQCNQSFIQLVNTTAIEATKPNITVIATPVVNIVEVSATENVTTETTTETTESIPIIETTDITSITHTEIDTSAKNTNITNNVQKCIIVIFFSTILIGVILMLIKNK